MTRSPKSRPGSQDPTDLKMVLVPRPGGPQLVQNFPDGTSYVGGVRTDSQGQGLTDEEVLAVLTGGPDAVRKLRAATLTAATPPVVDDTDEPDGDDDSDADVAAEKTGAMVALLPSLDDQQRLALDGGEMPEDLHVTLCYLGPATNFDLGMQAGIIDAVGSAVASWYACSAEAFGAAIWNPDGTKPCVVLQLSGDDLGELQECVYACLERWEDWLPEQHDPWSPHVALEYTNQLTSLSQALTKVGPITLDRVRVAFAGQNVDFILQSMPAPPAGAVTAGGSVTETVTFADAPPVTGSTGQPVPPVGNTEVPAVMPTFSGGTPWWGVLVVEGQETGDGRMFEPGSLTWIDGGGQPLSFAPENQGEHNGSVVAARIDRMWRDVTNPNIIYGAGVFDDNGSNGAEALRLVKDRFMNGVSVDVDSIKDSDVELVFPPESGDELMDMFASPELTIFHAGRIRGATIVAIPAFVEATIQLGEVPTDLMTAAPMTSGTGGYSIENVIPHNCGASPDMNLCVAGLAALASRPDLGLDIDRRRTAYMHLARHIEGFGLTVPEFTPTEEIAALTAAATEHPPTWMFQDPKFTGPTAVSIAEPDDAGWQYISGHAATWETCHTSFPGACTTPPFESEGHTYFRLGEVLTASGDRIPIGSVTLGTGHAPLNMDPRRVAEHYDHTGTCVALVASGNDDHGIWVAGMIKPGTPPGRVMELRAAKLSGDWRRYAGKLRLVAMLAVNVPGFPVPRLRAQVSDGVQTSLVAAGVLPDESILRQRRQTPALRAVAASLQRRLGRDPKTLAAELRARVHPTVKET